MKRALSFIFITLLAAESGKGGGPTTFQQPDLSVGKVNNANTIRKGDNIYNTTAAGQTLRLVGRGGQKMVFFFCIMNDGTADELFFLKGTRKNRKFDITYKELGGNNISSQVFNGNYSKFLASPGDAVYVKTIAKPTRHYRNRRASIKIKARVRSDFDPQAKDCARVIFNNRP